MAAISVTRPRRGPTLAIAAIAATVLVAGALTTWRWVVRAPAAETTGPSAVARADFLEETGIRIVRVSVTGGGGLLDLRYQVIDPDKAAVVHASTPELVDDGSGRVIDTLFMGHEHGGDPKAGYTYPLLFVNEHGALASGDAVSVVIGAARLPHVPVS